MKSEPKEGAAWVSLGSACQLSGNKMAALNTIGELRQINPVMAEKLFDLVLLE